MNTTSGPLASPAPAVPDIAVTIERSLARQGDLRIHLAGELDSWSGPTFSTSLIGMSPPVHIPGQHPAEIVLDLRELTFMDSAGLRAIETGRAKLLAAGWVVKAGPAQPCVQRLLHFMERSGWLVGGPLMPEDSPPAAAA